MLVYLVSREQLFRWLSFSSCSVDIVRPFNFVDEKKPSLQEIASERSIAQRATGWKIHHVAAQLDELVRRLT